MEPNTELFHIIAARLFRYNFKAAPFERSSMRLAIERENAGRIRLKQLEAVDRMIPAMMIANMICSGALTLLLLDLHKVVLPFWFALISLISATRCFQAVRNQKNVKRTSASRRAIQKSTWQAVFMAFLFMSVPTWLLTKTVGLPFATIVCLITGFLWAGGLVLATIPSAALAYVGVVVAMTTSALTAASGGLYHLFICFLFFIGSLTVIRSVLRQSKLFNESHALQFDLEAQREVIGVLLKDFEEQASDWLWETGQDLRYSNVSGRFAEALGRPCNEIAGTAFGSLLISGVAGNEEARATIRAQADLRMTFRDVVVPFDIEGRPCWWSLSGRPFYAESGRFLGYRGVCADITVARRAQDQIAYLAHHDALTNLPNRTAFSGRLDQALTEGQGKSLALLSLDLDGFKSVNDRYGHPCGDALLVAVAQRLRKEAGRGDMVARLGGDEFIVLSEIAPAEVDALAERIIGALKEPFDLEGNQVSIGVSIGIAFVKSDGHTSEILLRNVDAALYRAKEEGRGNFRFFAAEMDQSLQERRRLLQDLRLAIPRSELVLYFQPYIASDSGQVTGCEALLRWQHPERGLLSPLQFIPIAEESGLIVEIGAWVLEAACCEAASWTGTQRVSVNVSARQFQIGDLPGAILVALARSGLSPSRLEVEVTETILLGDTSQALSVLRHIRAMGVQVALDDFGTGYSSLGYLRSFPFDKIKIDKSFVDDLVMRHDSKIIVQAILDIAAGLNMSITAEGVETLEQASHLRLMGCHELQGYLFARPKPAEQLNMHAVHPAPDDAEVGDFAMRA